MINYQGKLLLPTGAPIADGTYGMKFAIYDVPTGGTALWSETNPSVQVKGGLFAVMLGSVTNLPANIFDSPDRFFGVKVGTDSEMSPRQKIASVAYAQVAGAVNDGAITTSKIADGAIDSDKIAARSVTASKIEEQEAWNEIGTAGKPAFQSGWTNYGNGWDSAAYMKDSFGFVHIKGMVKGGPSLESIIFTLPIGYRPKGILRHPTDAHGDYGWVNINPNGEILGRTNTIDTNLSSICFKAEQ